MTPAGQNYPIHDHTFLFWGIYLGAIVTVTIVLLGVFLIMVHRTSQSTAAAVEVVPEPSALPAPSDTTAHEAAPAA